MIASDATLRQLLESGDVSAFPDFERKDIRQSGMRVYLGREILVPNPPGADDYRGGVDLRRPEDASFESHDVLDSGYTLSPSDLVLGVTTQRFKFGREWVAALDGRSSLARIGLSVHATSAVLDNMYDDHRSIVLEIQNRGPFDLVLHSGLPIGMLILLKATRPIEGPDSDQYAGQMGVLAALPGVP